MNGNHANRDPTRIRAVEGFSERRRGGSAAALRRILVRARSCRICVGHAIHAGGRFAGLARTMQVGSRVRRRHWKTLETAAAVHRRNA